MESRFRAGSGQGGEPHGPQLDLAASPVTPHDSRAQEGALIARLPVQVRMDGQAGEGVLSVKVPGDFVTGT